MNPRLIDISTGIKGSENLTLPSYFAMVAIGFVIGAILVHRWSKRHGIDHRLMLNFVIWMAIFGVIGARLLHVLADGHFWDYVHVCTNPSLVDWKVDAKECRALKGAWDSAKGLCHPTQTNCFAWADLNAGGFAYYGGFVACALFAISFFRRNRLPGAKILDMSGWALMLGLAWGRMGCFLASCCFGVRTDSFLGVVFPTNSGASRYQWEQGWLDSYRQESLPVHPTQLYESAAGLAIAAIAYLWLRPRKRFDGAVFCSAMVMYAIARFSLEFIRRDERGGLFGLSTSQILAIVIAIACGWLWFHLKRKVAKIEHR